MIDSTQIFGVSASILSSILFIPQLYHMIKLKSGKDVSYIFVLLQILASILWIVYGYLINSMPLIFCDSFVIITSLAIIFAKYKFSLIESS